MRHPQDRPEHDYQPDIAPDKQTDVIVAGHICLDLIPDMGQAGLAALAEPGALVHVGGAVLSTGGTVANSGLALHRLGVAVKLMGKVGDDAFGRLIMEALGKHSPRMADGMIVSGGEQSSYSIVISPSGSDRIFLHCPGTNDTFKADDVSEESLDGAKLLHFGYPPLMKEMYENDGRELEKLLAKAKAKGLTVSLDMSRPDPDSPSGKVDWRSILKRILPYVDLYLPSWEETVFMLGSDRSGSGANGGAQASVSAHDLASISGQLVEMGAAVVGIKLGEEGLYVRTTGDADRMSRIGAAMPSTIADWRERELLAPCFETTVVGTTGAGDCTIAGFLCGLLHGLPLEETMTAAVAVGACSVETLDATSGIVPWTSVVRRIEKGWRRRAPGLPLEGWTPGTDGVAWIGPYDKSRTNPV
ncbi:carbohydrate kinase family protein [Paenibacillus hemerocallicola]|uniref:carbohydrate kinase family protein n=1 Tax=Paenibacillus hemerocallicola TaxID=1172614 RepID=UPI001FE4A41E|nr:carbohydrate kinase family protein [Paenibacillus hemerocallicola]